MQRCLYILTANGWSPIYSKEREPVLYGALHNPRASKRHKPSQARTPSWGLIKTPHHLRCFLDPNSLCNQNGQVPNAGSAPTIYGETSIGGNPWHSSDRYDKQYQRNYREIVALLVQKRFSGTKLCGSLGNEKGRRPLSRKNALHSLTQLPVRMCDFVMSTVAHGAHNTPTNRHPILRAVSEGVNEYTLANYTYLQLEFMTIMTYSVVALVADQSCCRHQDGPYCSADASPFCAAQSPPTKLPRRTRRDS